jgi:hypothetical protein
LRGKVFEAHNATRIGLFFLVIGVYKAEKNHGMAPGIYGRSGLKLTLGGISMKWWSQSLDGLTKATGGDKKL